MEECFLHKDLYICIVLKIYVINLVHSAAIMWNKKQQGGIKNSKPSGIFSHAQLQCHLYVPV